MDDGLDLSPGTRETLESVSYIHTTDKVETEYSFLGPIVQDLVLDDLSKTLARQEEIGALLSNELAAQEGLLSGLDSVTDRQRARLTRTWQNWIALDWDHTSSNCASLPFLHLSWRIRTTSPVAYCVRVVHRMYVGLKEHTN